MAKHRALMLWTDAWIADTGHLTTLKRGHYLDLLVLMWRTPGCHVPNDDQWLGHKLRLTPDEIATELRPLILEFCQTDGNWIWQKRLQSEFQWSEKISRHNRASAKSRWEKEKGICDRNASVTVSSKKERDGRKGPEWAPSGYSNGRSLGNGKASSIGETLK